MTGARTEELTGRTYVVTGANSGIGFEVARDLVGRGAHVVLAVRDAARGERAAAQLQGAGSTSIIELDLADLDRVAHAAKLLLERHDRISGLVCNAGVMGGPLLLSAQGFELQMATNHLGHAALVPALWPALDAAAARVVLMSSGEARTGQLSPSTHIHELLNPSPHDGKQAYRNSKQANLLFARKLHRRCATAGSSVSAVAAHPGAVATNLLRRQLERTGRPRLAGLSNIATSMMLRSPAAGALAVLTALDDATPGGAFVAPSGIGQLRGRPQVTDVYAAGEERSTAGRLWQLTEEALGMTLPPLPDAPPSPAPAARTTHLTNHPNG